jgi:hypothetical protein
VYCDILSIILIPQFCLFLRHQTMDKVQKHNSFNTNTPSSESYKNYLVVKLLRIQWWDFVPAMLNQMVLTLESAFTRPIQWPSGPRRTWLNNNMANWNAAPSSCDDRLTALRNSLLLETTSRTSYHIFDFRIRYTPHSSSQTGRANKLSSNGTTPLIPKLVFANGHNS